MGHLAAVEVTTWGGGGGCLYPGVGAIEDKVKTEPRPPAPLSAMSDPGARADVSSGASVAGVWPGLDNLSQLATSEG